MPPCATCSPKTRISVRNGGFDLPFDEERGIPIDI